MIKAVIFDLDGTLLNTLGDIDRCLNEIIEYFGYDRLTNKELKNNIGKGSRRLVKDSLPLNVTPDVLHRITNKYMMCLTESNNELSTPYRGVEKMLKDLVDNGYRLAIVSNKMEDAVVKIVNEFFGDIFEVIIGESKTMPVKPHPKMLKEVIKRLGLERDEVIYVGDTEVDIKTARNARVDVISATWGFRNRGELVRKHPTHAIRRPKHLVPLLEDLNNDE